MRYKRSARRHGWETRAADDHLAVSDQLSITARPFTAALLLSAFAGKREQNPGSEIDCPRESDTELRAEGL